MTTRFSALLLLALLSAKCGPAEGKCPTGDVLPCKCGSRFLQDHHDGEVQLDCSSANTSEEISSASRASWPSSQLWQFRLTDNKLVEELPEGVMGDLSFQSIWVSDTALKRIHPSAILPSGDRLVNLSVENSRLEEFPFGVLPTLRRLEGLWLQNNSLAAVPAIRSESLQLLYLSYNNITRVNEDGWATPDMRHLDMSYNPLSEFPSTVIKSLRKLEEFYCSGCNLGPTLSNGLLRFRSKTLKLVVLWENGISRLGPKDISGIRTDTVVYLTHNKIAMLDEGIFRPTLEIMSQGKGVLHLEGNPVQCGRNLEWLALAPKLLRKVKGACEDGTSLACSVLDLRPCSCEEHSDGMTVDCSSARTSEEVSSAFDKIWPSARLSHFILLNNSEIQELPEGVFGAHSFQNIYLSKTAVKAIHPSAILSSRGQLVNLTVENSRLGRFPFHVLSMFPRLEGLWLRNNSLTSVPAIHSESLEFLYLPNNGIEKIKENGWATPNLREIDLGHNPLLEFPSVVIKSLKKLEKFYCPECHLGPTLSSGLLEFQSNSLRLVSLWKNGISRLEPKAITGLRPATSLTLTDNNITILTKESFRPMLEVLSLGNGVLEIGGNPIQCGCSVAWLVHHRKLLRKVHGKCQNGTEFESLDSDSLISCPRCLYECVSAQMLLLCTPGTVILSKVPTCGPEELCCQPDFSRNDAAYLLHFLGIPNLDSVITWEFLDGLYRC